MARPASGEVEIAHQKPGVLRPQYKKQTRAHQVEFEVPQGLCRSQDNSMKLSVDFILLWLGSTTPTALKRRRRSAVGCGNVCVRQNDSRSKPDSGVLAISKIDVVPDKTN